MIGEFAALGAALTWAVAPIMYRKALSTVSPFSANIVRCITNSAILVLVLVASGLFGVLVKLPSEVIAIVVASGLIGLGLGDTFYMIALKSIGVARAVPLAASYPLFSLVWATLLLGEGVTLLAVAGTIVILFGIWFLSRETVNSKMHFHGKFELAGVVFSLATAVVWSISLTLMDFAVTMPGVVSGLEGNYAIVTVRIVGMTIGMLALAPLLDRRHEFLKVKLRTVVLLCVGGLVANGLGWLLMNYSFLNISESQAVPISSTTPLFSALAGFAFLREKITGNNILGAILVVAGVVMIFIV